METVNLRDSTRIQTHLRQIKLNSPEGTPTLGQFSHVANYFDPNSAVQSLDQIFEILHHHTSGFAPWMWGKEAQKKNQ